MYLINTFDENSLNTFDVELKLDILAKTPQTF